jgi:tRNA pseudouridine13 synthase
LSIHGRRSESWTRAALSPPRAHGTPLAAAQLRNEPDDFRVEEQLSFVPSEDGPHWLLQVEKRSANTRWVAAEIARLGGFPVSEVGYAGLKDRHAIASQWFSVPARPHPAAFWSGVRTDEFRVLDVHANLRKLKRGALAGNRFRIRLRKVSWSREELESKLAALREHGAPNYFGPQRFGRDGFNLDRAAQWMQSGTAPAGRAERGFALSAARALIFNAVLGRRVQSGDWSSLKPGDLASLEGSSSHFAVTTIDDELLRRLHAFDIHPSGPLWGRGDPETQRAVLDDELEVAREFGGLATLLQGAGLDQERRALRCAVRDLKVESDAGTVVLSFGLGRGQFATAVLREIMEFPADLPLEGDVE